MADQNQSEPRQTNIVERLIDEPWRMEEDYKRLIITLETQNEKYRNELYQLGETVNKILDKTKIKKDNTPNLESQLEVIRKELENANKFIEIYKKQLKNIQKSESATAQLQTIAQSEEILKGKHKELADMKKQVKELTAKNKALEYRIMEYSKRGKAKSIDTAALMMKEALYENKQLKTKLEQLEEQEKRKSAWLKNNVESTQDLKKKIQKLPSIQRRSADRLGSSLPKLENEKKIYTKWLETYKNKGFDKVEKQIEDLEKINTMVNQKISTTTKELKEIQEQINRLKEKVTPAELEKIKQASKKQEETKKKMKDWSGNSGIRVRRSRRDWVGKFDGVRFSDSRTVREEARLFKIVFNSVGYYNFWYYSVKDHHKTFNPPLPFDVNSVSKGKESTFTVEYPDYIKEFKLYINLKQSRIYRLDVVSNMGITAQFISEEPKEPKQFKEAKSTKKEKKQRPPTQETVETVYSLDIKTTEAPICMFGSYSIRNDRTPATAYLEGLGAELIEDFVEEKL